MNTTNQKIYYICASFLSGFSLMVVELVSARVASPIVGSSVFTWTSVIGVTLLGLSIGSFIGGKIADIRDEIKARVALPLAFSVSSFMVCLIPPLIKTTGFILGLSNSIIFLNVIISLYLFLLPAIAIGTIQPILLKRYAQNFLNIGKEYGTLSSTWSVGSILGVFLTGFFFISYIGSKETLLVITGLLFIAGLFFSWHAKKLRVYIILIGLICVLISVFNNSVMVNTFTSKTNIILDTETDYYRTRVADTDLPGFGKSRVLALDFDIHSVDTAIKSEYFYPEMYPVFSYINKDIKSILTIGAGAYTMPKHFNQFYTQASISVMETDPALVKVGTKYFGVDPTKIITQVGDARVLLPKSNQKYDLIFGDAYNSFISVPWDLLTKEWNDKVKEKITNGGVYAVNFIGAIDGPKSVFTQSVIKTFKLTFPNYYVFAFGDNKQDTQNIVLVGVNGPLPLTEAQLVKDISNGENPFISKRLLSTTLIHTDEGVLLTDNFAPVERLMNPLIGDYFPEYLTLINQVF